MENNLIIFIHLVAAAVGMGSLVFCLVLFLPAMEKLPNQEKVPEEYSIPYKTMEVLAPTVLVCVLTLIGSGLYYLWANYTRQVDLTPGYYDLFGIKMLFVVASLFLSVYHTFTLRSRIANLDLTPENRKLVPATLKKMVTLSQVLLGTLSAAAFMGIWMARF
ncbi:MAG: hypothetical protein ACE5E9_13425 [Nitrospinaceae bacterium]